MNRRIPNGTYGGVRGRELITLSYSIGLKIAIAGDRTYLPVGVVSRELYNSSPLLVIP
jgi:hypothetical protein